MTAATGDPDALLAQTGPIPALAPMVYLAAEETQRDRQATDALFLTFNADLAFLEARLLGLCHASGAVVTVIADAEVRSPDVRSVRFAGRHYHVGLAATASSFDPKVSLLVGPERALAMVGSGNLTLGGWQYNAELVTVLTADRSSAPRAMADLRDLLGSLTRRLSLDPMSSGAVSRCVARLDDLLRFADLIDTGHRLAASWDGPLIDRLPEGPVDELLLTAPFHDQAGSAVRALLQRLQPRAVRVAVQPGWTSLNPRALGAALAEYVESASADVTVIRDEEDPGNGRYRHGKLIEWSVGETRYSMTGSPNLSVAALKETAGNRGNWEVAVISPTGRSLFPGGVPVDLRDVPPVRVEDKRSTGVAAAPVVTAAVDTDNGIRLHLAQVHCDTEIEISQLTDPPDRWRSAGAASAGTETIDVLLDIAGGSRVRLTWLDVNGVRRWSAVQFVTNGRTALARRGHRDQRTQTQRAQPADIWGDDPSFLSAIMGDLTAVAAELAARRSAATLASGAHDGDDRSGDRASPDDHHVEPWLWIQSETLARLGPGLAPYALALPSLGALDSWEPEWVDTAIADTEVGLDDDTAEDLQEVTLSEAADAEPDLIDQRDDDEYLRGRRRIWCENAVRIASGLPIELRLFVLRVTVRFWQGGNWAGGEVRPLQLVASLVRSLTEDGLSPQLETRVGSLSAIALAFVREAIDPSVHDERTLLYNRLVTDSAHLLLAAQADITSTYLHGLVPSAQTDYWLGEVEDCLYAATSGDPLAEVEDELSLDFTVTRPGPRMLHLRGRLSNPAQRALEVIGQAEDWTGIAVWASNPHGDWALVVWQKPDLITVTRHGPGRTRWRHQRLTGLVGPAALATQIRFGESPSAYDIVTKPKFCRTDAAAEVLASVGIIDPAPPPAPAG